MSQDRLVEFWRLMVDKVSYSIGKEDWPGDSGRGRSGRGRTLADEASEELEQGVEQYLLHHLSGAGPDAVQARRRLGEVASVGEGLDLVSRCTRLVERLIEPQKGALKPERLHAGAVMEWEPLLKLSCEFYPSAPDLLSLLFALQYRAAATGLHYKASLALEGLESSLGAGGLKEEIEEELLAVLSGREQRIVGGRYGLEKEHLAGIGEELDLSRERIRQIQNGATAKLQQVYGELPLPRLRSAMTFVRSSNARSVKEIDTLLKDYGLLQEGSSRASRERGNGMKNDTETFLTIWRALGPPLQPFPAEITHRPKAGTAEGEAARQRPVVEAARRLLRESFVVDPAEVRRLPEGLPDDRADQQVVRKRAAEIAEVAQTLREAGMIEVETGRFVEVRTFLAFHRAAGKMILACGPLTVEEIHRGLNRRQRSRKQPGDSMPPPQTLEVALVHHRAFRKTNPGKIDLVRGGRKLSSPGASASLWLTVVRVFGPVVHSTVIRRVFEEEGYKVALAYDLMQHSELVQPLGEGFFCLPGAQGTNEDRMASARLAGKPAGKIVKAWRLRRLRTGIIAASKEAADHAADGWRHDC